MAHTTPTKHQPPATAEFISHAATAETMALGTEPFAILADAQRTGGLLTCVEVWVPPAGGPPPHRHEREDEAFYVLEGTLTLHVGDQKLQLPPGGFAWAPRRLRHRFANETDKPVRMLVFMLPGGIERAFRAASTPVPPGTNIAPPPDPAAMATFMDACSAHGIDLAPTPAGDGPTTKPYTAHARTAETISMVGDVYHFLATSDQTDGQFYMHEALVPPGGGPPPHAHTREDEAFYILSGTLTFEIEGRRHLAPPGSFVWAPRNQRHRFLNQSGAPVRCLVIAVPAGIEAMFRQAGTPLSPGSTVPIPPTDQHIGEVLSAARAHGVTIVVPA